jgi:hypothetical protein
MTNNRTMTLEEALEKEEGWYRVIVLILYKLKNQEIQPKHLKWILVENHLLTKEKTIRQMARFSQNLPDFLSICRIKKIPGQWGINSLEKFLTKLEKMKVIEHYEIKGEKDKGVRLTQQGRCQFLRWYVHYLLDTFIPIDAINYEEVMTKIIKNMSVTLMDVGGVIVDVPKGSGVIVVSKPVIVSKKELKIIKKK